MVAQRGPSGGCDRGVSQVIGIVLLVGITVVLVGLTAVSLTDFAEQNQEPAPRFATETEFNDTYAGNGQYLDITHDAGAALDTDSLSVRVDGARVWTTSGTGGTITGDATYDGNVIADQVGEEFSATETVTLNRTAFADDAGNDLTGSDYLDLRDATVLVVWENEDGSRTEILYECSVGVPDCEGE